MVKKGALILGLVLSLLFSGPVLAALIWGKGTANATASATLQKLINDEHYRVCGRNLSYNPQLMWAAQWKASDMGYRNYFSHRTLDGKYVWDFYSRMGIDYSGGAGEILAYNVYPSDISALAAYKAFMGSISHRAEIRNCRYDRFGIGTFNGTSEKKYYAVEFTDIN